MIVLDTHVWVRWVDSLVNPLPTALVEKIESADTPRKLLDVSRVKQLGWQAKTGLRSGIEQAYADFLATFSEGAEDILDSGVLRR